MGPNQTAANHPEYMLKSGGGEVRETGDGAGEKKQRFKAERKAARMYRGSEGGRRQTDFCVGDPPEEEHYAGFMAAG